MKAARVIARILIGALFIFSGYVKVIDPMGSAIKFGEYFEAFHLPALIPIALVFGILLAVGELCIGLGLFLGVRVKEASWAALIFMIFFTLLTFALAVFNPVEDCGCFGDAIKLTNWQTFYKNLIILPIVIFIFVQRKKYKPLLSCTAEWIVAGCLMLFSVGLAVYCHRHLPLIDFMAYKVGVNIPEAKTIPEGAPQTIYDNSYVYQKDGQEVEINLNKGDALPDSTWTFVRVNEKLVQKGYIPPAKDFAITGHSGEYITDSILNLPGLMMFITSPDIKKADLKHTEQINKLYDYCREQNIHFMMLSGSAEEVNQKYVTETSAQYPIYHTDETVLKSMVRSNPGLMLLNNATIVKKWSINDVPDSADIEKLKADQPTAESAASHERNITFVLVLALVAVFVGIICFRKKYKNKE